MENGEIEDYQISASSETFSGNHYHGAHNSRLDRPAQLGMSGSWSAHTNDLNQWIQVDLMIPTWVAGVMIQGRQDYSQWVKEYTVEYSSDGQNWMTVQPYSDHDGMVS